MPKQLPFIFLLLLVAGALTAQQNRGYLNITSFGILAGTSADDKPAPLSLLTENNYRIIPALSLGITTGIEQLNENTLPLALNLKIFLPAGKGNFFFSGLGGYSVALEKPDYENIEKAHGGITAGVETGLLFSINCGAGVFFALGYRYQVLNYELTEWYTGTYERKISYNRFSIRMGIAIGSGIKTN